MMLRSYFTDENVSNVIKSHFPFGKNYFNQETQIESHLFTLLSKLGIWDTLKKLLSALACSG